MGGTFRVEIGGFFRVEIDGIKQICSLIKSY